MIIRLPDAGPALDAARWLVGNARRRVRNAGWQARLYLTGERPLAMLPADLAVLWRDTTVVAHHRLANLAGCAVEIALTVECAARDAHIRAGRNLEDALGVPEPDRVFAYGPSGMHLSTEPCPGGCGPDDDGAELS